MLSSKGEHKTPIKKELEANNYEVNIITSEADVHPLVVEIKPVALIYDWLVLDPDQGRKFLFRLNKLSNYAHIYRIMITKEVTTEMLALAYDVNINKVMSYGSASLNLGNELKMALTAQEWMNDFSRIIRDSKKDAKRYSQVEIDQLIEKTFGEYPHDPKVKIEYGNLKFREEKYEETIKIGEEIIREQLTNVRAMNLIARAYMKLGNFSKALSFLEKADILSPKNPKRLVLIGNAFYGIGDKESAKKSYKMAAELDPTESEAVLGLGKIMLDEGAVNSVLELFKNSVSEDEVAGFFNAAAVSAVKDNKLGEALDLYETALRALITPKLKPRILFNIALTQRRLHNLNKAKKSLEEALLIDPNFQKGIRQKIEIEKILKDRYTNEKKKTG